MSEQPKSKKHIHLFALLLALAVGAYFLLVPKKNADQTPQTPAVVMEETAPTDMPPQPEPQVKEEDVLVPTKTLAIPNEAEEKTAAPVSAVPEQHYNPAVADMMTPRTRGEDSAPIKVTEYSSLTCGHCAAFEKDDMPKIEEAYIKTGKVQFIFKEYPLNEPAVVASQILRCMPKDQFVNFMNLLFEQQENWAYVKDYQDKLFQYAKLAGLGEDEIKACANNIELKKAIIGDMQAANEKFKIASTPTFVVNDGEKIIVGHQPFSFFQETFDGLLAGKPEAEKTAE